MGFQKIKALIQGRCPQCRIGYVFFGSPYSLRKRRINEICSHCGLRYEIEPGYFYAALYVSYGLVVIELLVAGCILFLLSHSESPWFYLVGLALIIIGLSPVNFRLGRLVLLYYLTPRIKYKNKFENDEL